ncbi:MAG: VOC family protein, partial [Acidobacteria bacterium]|nr:VOC family protein [Acidobacteriota bacterium]
MGEPILPEQLHDQLDEAVSAIVARRETSASAEPGLAELVTLGHQLHGLPRDSFKLQLKRELMRSATMPTPRTTAATETRKALIQDRAAQQTITLYLTVKRAEQLVEFVKQVFGGVELFRTTGSAGGLHAEVIIGQSRLMIGGYESVEEMPTALHLYVPDADAVYQRALEAGATSLEEPVDQFYGDREAGVKDPTGNVWWIATHKLGPAETYIPEGMRPVTPFLHPIGAPALIDFM